MLFLDLGSEATVNERTNVLCDWNLFIGRHNTSQRYANYPGSQ